MFVCAGRVAATHVRAFSTEATKPLYGTVASHSSYIFLHANEPPSAFPAKVSTAIQRELHLRTMKWGTIVNFAWTGEHPHLPDGATSATVFSTLGGRLEIPRVTPENMDEVESKLKAHIRHGNGRLETDAEIHLYVCTHGARDCRCGEHGSQVARALKEEAERRKLNHRVKVREVGHVGGHKHAANLLVYPQGEWLGRLRPDDVPGVFDAILAQPARPFGHQDPPVLPDHWRGRMGLGKDEQISLFERYANERSV